MLGVLRFTVELAALVAVTTWGLQLTAAPLRWPLAAACATALAAVWGRLIAPKSPKRLADPARLVTELVVFFAAGAAISVTTTRVVAICFTLLAVSDAFALRATDSISPIDTNSNPTNWELS